MQASWGVKRHGKCHSERRRLEVTGMADDVRALATAAFTLTWNCGMDQGDYGEAEMDAAKANLFAAIDRQDRVLKRVEALATELQQMSGGSLIGWETGRDYCVERLSAALAGTPAERTSDECEVRDAGLRALLVEWDVRIAQGYSSVWEQGYFDATTFAAKAIRTLLANAAPAQPERAGTADADREGVRPPDA